MLLYSLIVAICVASDVSGSAHVENRISSPDSIVVSAHVNADITPESVSESLQSASDSLQSVNDAIKGSDYIKELRRKFNSYFTIAGAIYTLIASVASILTLLACACCCRLSPCARCILFAVCIVEGFLLYAIVL